MFIFGGIIPLLAKIVKNKIGIHIITTICMICLCALYRFP